MGARGKMGVRGSEGSEMGARGSKRGARQGGPHHLCGGKGQNGSERE